ncbi:hypothetical protein K461DRAFT_22206 [Myriangium duriaei CBS 260.36]|uniref:Uncharacterized protein n=1 Tax=Myriangium duriaei CBS 260.36 TaxID=1168546 RepID=A0A9P4JDJ0_9PEZI|nr:hypothetical protein K461DRAFT_22206 [Myriangium duriaei CBS 260.36]
MHNHTSTARKMTATWSRDAVRPDASGPMSARKSFHNRAQEPRPCSNDRPGLLIHLGTVWLHNSLTNHRFMHSAISLFQTLSAPRELTFFFPMLSSHRKPYSSPADAMFGLSGPCSFHCISYSRFSSA